MKAMLTVLAVILVSLYGSNSLSANNCYGQMDGARLPYTNDCNRFLVCKNQQIEKISYCPDGLHFNRQLSVCDFKTKAGCEVIAASDIDAACDCCCPPPSDCGQITPTPPPPITPTPPPPITPTPPPPITPTPSPQCDPKNPPPGGCPCDPKNPPPGGCPCDPKNPPPGGCPCDPNDPGCQSAGPSTGPSGTVCITGGVCEDQNDGKLFPDPKSPGYIVCQCGCEILRPCPEGLIFNPKVSVCDWPQKS